jgi:hypothetical protein
LRLDATPSPNVIALFICAIVTSAAPPRRDRQRPRGVIRRLSVSTETSAAIVVWPVQRVRIGRIRLKLSDTAIRCDARHQSPREGILLFESVRGD